MQNDQHYSFNIKLSQDFLKKTHAHPIIAEMDFGGFYDEMWKNIEESVPFNFGGKYTTQFISAEEIKDFSMAFDRLLERKSISEAYKPSLLYFILFLGQDFEKQSIDRNKQNRLKDYANFLSDLFINGIYHFQQMSKKKDYTMVHDPYTQEYFFAKKHLVESMDPEDLFEFVPDEKDKADIIKYLRVTIGTQEMYVPEEIIPAIIGTSSLKSIHGETMNSLNFPRQFKYELFNYTVKTMMDEHKTENTEFYRVFAAPELDMKTLKSIYKAYQKDKLSNVIALTRIGLVISDFLTENKLLKSKTAIADFLWEYFALFKAYEYPKLPTPPKEYSELPNFYMQNRITKESIRLMMKGA